MGVGLKNGEWKAEHESKSITLTCEKYVTRDNIKNYYQGMKRKTTVVEDVMQPHVFMALMTVRRYGHLEDSEIIHQIPHGMVGYLLSVIMQSVQLL